VADGEIVKRVIPGDLVVTADIPLAAEVIAKAEGDSIPAGSAIRRYHRGILAMRIFWTPCAPALPARRLTAVPQCIRRATWTRGWAQDGP